MATREQMRTVEGRLLALRERLERAKTRTVQEVEPGLYLVTGGAEPHYVAPGKRWAPRCDCGDYLWTETMCLHRLAVALHLNGQDAERVLRIVTSSAEWQAGSAAEGRA